MAESTRKPARVKAPRSCRLMDVGPGHRVLIIVEGSGEGARDTKYHLRQIDVDFGRGLELEKFTTDGGDVYAVHLDSTGDSCTCLGHLRWGHRTVCRHIGAVKALIAAGKL